MKAGREGKEEKWRAKEAENCHLTVIRFDIRPSHDLRNWDPPSYYDTTMNKGESITLCLPLTSC